MNTILRLTWKSRKINSSNAEIDVCAKCMCKMKSAKCMWWRFFSGESQALTGVLLWIFQNFEKKPAFQSICKLYRCFPGVFFIFSCLNSYIIQQILSLSATVVLYVEVIMTISSLFIFFLRKIFHTHKIMSQAKINKQNKNKLTRNNKGNNFSRVHKLLGVTCFCARESFSSKKNKQAWNCLDNLNIQCY